MKNLNFIAVFLLVFSNGVFANTEFECKANQFHVPNVDITVVDSPNIKKTSASFMESDNYWHLAAYELHKQEKLYLLEGIHNLDDAKAITATALNNYINRLEDEMFYTTNIRESFSVSISNITGTGYILDASYDSPNSNEIFVFWMVVKGEQIFFGDLHITIDGVQPSLSLVKERLTNFIETCEIVTG